jgi:ammonia channel protein AmtB
MQLNNIPPHSWSMVSLGHLVLTAVSWLAFPSSSALEALEIVAVQVL